MNTKKTREAIEAFLADRGATLLPPDPMIDLLESEGLQQIDGGVTARSAEKAVLARHARTKNSGGYQILFW